MKKYILRFSSTLLTVAFQLAAAHLGIATTFNFSNTAPITINDNAAATPYPATINVSGFTARISDLNVTITGLSHTFPTDIGILLVGPGGQSVVLMDNTGGVNPIINVNIVFDDEAATGVPNPIIGSLASGTYRPTNNSPTDVFGAPAPGGPYGTALSVFDNTLPNGIWQLFVRDFSAGDSGLISGGFSLQVTTPEPTSILLLGLGLFTVAASLRRKTQRRLLR
jgi:subtilisin-like proprotein convertase family protein